LLDECQEIDHDPVSNHAPLSAAENARRDEVEDVFRAAVNDRVAGIITALAPDNDVRLGGENVDDLALAFITPLRSDQDCVRHEKKDNKLSRRIRLDTFGTAQNDRMGR